MKLKKSLVVAGAVATMGLTAATGLGVASAATSTDSTSSSGASSLVDKIASKFNLNKDDVQKVFDEDRSEREAERQEKIETALTQAVTDSKITQAQKEKILAKLAGLKTQREEDREAMQDKTEDERRAAMEQERTDLQTWATDNGIPTEYLRYVMGGGGHGSPGGPGFGKPADSTTSSTSATTN